MTEQHTDTDPAKLTPNEARGARPVKGMPWVLGISIVAVVIIGAVFLISFAG